MSKLLHILASIAALLVAGSAHADTLLGQSVSATLSTYFAVAPTISTPFSSPVVTFAGTDFTGGFTDVFAQTWVVTAAFTADTLTIDFSTPSKPFGNIGNVSGASIVDFSGFTELTTPLRFQSYSCDPGSTICSPFNIPYQFITTSNLTTFDVLFPYIRNGDSYNYTFVPAPPPPPPLPEPATWALMLVGFGGLGAMLRARRARGRQVPDSIL